MKNAHPNAHDKLSVKMVENAHFGFYIIYILRELPNLIKL